MWSYLLAIFSLLVVTASSSPVVTPVDARPEQLDAVLALCGDACLPSTGWLPIKRPGIVHRQVASLTDSSTSSAGGTRDVLTETPQTIGSAPALADQEIVPLPETTGAQMLGFGPLHGAVPIHHHQRDDRPDSNCTTLATTTATARPSIPTLTGSASAWSFSATRTIPTLSAFSTSSTTVITPAPASPTFTPAAGCVTTTMGAMSNPCATASGAAALTVFASTTTVFAPVDCHGCTSVFVLEPMWGCPLLSAGGGGHAVTAVDGAYTFTSTVCARMTGAEEGGIVTTTTTETFTDVVTMTSSGEGQPSGGTADVTTLWGEPSGTADVTTVSEGTMTSTRLVTVMLSSEASAMTSEAGSFAASIASSLFGLSRTAATVTARESDFSVSPGTSDGFMTTMVLV